jgi:autophagy-related protein 2
MSSYLASLTSIFGGLPSLPSLPSLPGFPSLPQNIQRRFVSFVLKRSLGHLVKAGALDPERLEAQVGTGLIEIRGAELDEEVS